MITERIRYLLNKVHSQAREVLGRIEDNDYRDVLSIRSALLDIVVFNRLFEKDIVISLRVQISLQ